MTDSAPRIPPVSLAFAQSHSVMLATARWFVRDFFGRYWPRLAFITGCGMAAASLQAAALSMLHGVFGRASLAEPITVPLLQVRIEPDQMIPAVSVALLLTLGGSAILTFVQARGVLRLWRHYQLHAMNAIYSEIAAARARKAVDAAALAESPVREILRQSQRLGAFARVVAGAISPLLRFCAFSVFAVSVNPELTLILLLAAVPAGGAALFFFAREASRATRKYAALGREALIEIDAHLAQAVAGQPPVLKLGDESRSTTVRRTDLLVRRIGMAYSARMAAAAISLAVLVAYALTAGSGMPADSAALGQTILYLSALALALLQLGQVATAVSSFGRFYPVVQLQRKALEAIAGATNPRQFQRRLSALVPGRAAAEPDADLE